MVTLESDRNHVLSLSIQCGPRFGVMLVFMLSELYALGA
jgi:hypothetical protein